MSKVYPSWRYHASLEPKLVKDESEDRALGAEWSDSPAAFDKSQDKKPEAPKKASKPIRDGSKA